MENNHEFADELLEAILEDVTKMDANIAQLHKEEVIDRALKNLVQELS